MTCRLFIDEVGNNDLDGSKADDNVRYLSLTAVLTKKLSHARTIQPRWDQFRSEIFGVKGPSLVLHRRELVRKEGDFIALQNPEIERRYNEGLLQLLGTLPYLVSTATIDKRVHLERYTLWHHDPYHYCLRCLVERSVLWLRRHNLTGDVAIEPRNRSVDRRVKESFRNLYDQGTENISKAIFQRHLTSHDIKFFQKNANVPAMQLCDLVAHPSYRSMKFENLQQVQPDDFGTKIAQILLDKKYARHPKTHEIVGYGRKWLP